MAETQAQWGKEAEEGRRKLDRIQRERARDPYWIPPELDNPRSIMDTPVR